MGSILRFRLTALAAAQFFDLGTFTRMIDRNGVAAEVNPIIAQGFGLFGLPLVIVVKIALVVLVGSVVVLLMRGSQPGGLNPRLAAVVSVVAVVVGLVGGVSNVLAM